MAKSFSLLGLYNRGTDDASLHHPDITCRSHRTVFKDEKNAEAMQASTALARRVCDTKSQTREMAHGSAMERAWRARRMADAGILFAKTVRWLRQVMSGWMVASSWRL